MRSIFGAFHHGVESSGRGGGGRPGGRGATAEASSGYGFADDWTAAAGDAAGAGRRGVGAPTAPRIGVARCVVEGAVDEAEEAEEEEEEEEEEDDDEADRLFRDETDDDASDDDDGETEDNRDDATAADDDVADDHELEHARARAARLRQQRRSEASRARQARCFDALRTPKADRRPDQLSLLLSVMARFKFFRAKLAEWHESDVRALLAAATLCEYARGRVVFEQGDPVDGVYVILRGAVEVTRRVDVALDATAGGGAAGPAGAATARPRRAAARPLQPRRRRARRRARTPGAATRRGPQRARAPSRPCSSTSRSSAWATLARLRSVRSRPRARRA